MKSGAQTNSSKPVSGGERIYLRPPQQEDWPEYGALIRKSRKLYKGFHTPLRNELEFSCYVNRCERDDYLGLLICRIEDDAILGMINLAQIVRGNFQNGCIGYSIGAPFAGQGYMTEALAIVLHMAFSEIDLHRLEANIQPDNAASIALVKRAGFRKEGFSPRFLKICGRWCDHERWAILADDWRAQGRSHAKPR